MILLPELDQNSPVNLRDQLREALSHRIFDGVLPVGSRLPSCRALSQQLCVSRNTVLGAYRKLVEDQLIEAHERSGYFVSRNLRPARPNGTASDSATSKQTSDIANKINLRGRPSALQIIRRPADWRSYPYPFVCNQIDTDLFPLAEWRECTRLALNAQNINGWASDYLYDDAEEFTTQIRTRMLPRRGVAAKEGEVLLTLGAQQALYLVASLFGRRWTQDRRRGSGLSGCAQRLFAVLRRGAAGSRFDDDGMAVDDRLRGCDAVYLTPNRQFPTTVTMSLERRQALLEMAERHNMLIVEDDYESEVDYRDQPVGSIHSIDGTGRVIYLGSLSKSLAPGLRLGYMAAQESLIREARALRGLMIRHPPLVLQHIAALFIRFGHQDALLSRLHREYAKRWTGANDSLKRHFGDFHIRGTKGGTSFMLTGPADLDARPSIQSRPRTGHPDRARATVLCQSAGWPERLSARRLQRPVREYRTRHQTAARRRR